MSIDRVLIEAEVVQLGSRMMFELRSPNDMPMYRVAANEVRWRAAPATPEAVLDNSPLPDQPMTLAEVVGALDAISGGDPAGAHADADAILQRIVPDEVAAAYTRLVERADGWWFA